MKKFIITLTILLSVIASIPFTSVGQSSLLIPIINKILEEKVEGHTVEVKEIKPTSDSFETRVLIDKSIELFLTGPINWQEQKFKFKYTVKSKEIELEGQRLPLNMDIKGLLVGTPKNLNVSGAGEAFDASLNYKFKVVDENISAINAVVKGAKIKQILALSKQPPYLDGRADISIDTPKLDLENPSGRATLKITDGKLNTKLLSKLLKVKIPPKESFKLTANGVIRDKKVKAEVDFLNELLNLNLKNLITTLKFEQIKTDYRLRVANLAYLKSFIKQPLRGAIDVNGKLFFDKRKNVIQLLANTNSLGGSSKISYNQKSLKADLKNVDISKILYMLELPKVVKGGNLNLKADIKDIKKLTGIYSLKTTGKLNQKLIKKLYKIDPLSEAFGLASVGEIKNSTLYSKQTTIKTALVASTVKNLKYGIKSGDIDTKFYVKVADLAKLKSITKQDLRGALSASGTLKYRKKNSLVKLVANTKSFGGSSQIIYNTKSLKAKLRDIDINKILYMVKQPKVTKQGVLTLDLDLKDIKKLNGSYALKAKGKLNRAVLKKVYKIDPMSEPFGVASRGVIKNNLLSSKKTTIKTALLGATLSNLKYGVKSGNIDTKFYLKVADLAKLKPIIKTDLRGGIATSGHLISKPKRKYTKLSGSTKSLGGVTSYRYEGKFLNLKLSKVSGVKLLSMLKQPSFFKSSIISGVVNLKDTKKMIGSFKLGSSGKFNRATIKKKNKLDLGSDLGYKLNINGSLKGDRVASKAKLTTSIVKLNLPSVIYNTKSKKVAGKYSLNAPSLIKLKPILKGKYHGSLSIAGKFWSDKVFHITGAGKKWDGTLNFRLDGDNLRATTKKIEITKLFKTLGYDPVLKGLANSSLKYNIATENGDAKIDIAKSMLVRTKLVQMLDIVIHKDLTKEIFNTTKITSKITKKMLKFNFDMKSNRHRVYIKGGKIDRKKHTIDAVVAIYDKKKAYKAKIKGALKHPRVIPIFTKELKSRAVKEVKHLLKKNGVKVDKIDKKIKKIEDKVDKYVPKELKNQLKGILKGGF